MRLTFIVIALTISDQLNQYISFLGFLAGKKNGSTTVVIIVVVVVVCLLVAVSSVLFLRKRKKHKLTEIPQSKLLSFFYTHSLLLIRLKY